MADFFPVLGLTRAKVRACGITGSGLNTSNPTDEEMEWMARDFKRFLLGEGVDELEIIGQYFEYKYEENRKIKEMN